MPVDDDLEKRYNVAKLRFHYDKSLLWMRPKANLKFDWKIFPGGR